MVGSKVVGGKNSWFFYDSSSMFPKFIFGGLWCLDVHIKLQ
jgi:hypothetical protein